MVHKNQVIEIIKCLDSYMNKTDKKEIGAKEANAVLEEEKILSDSKTRPGLPLRRKLRGGMLPHAYKKGSEWIIPISDGKTQKCEVSLPVTKTKDIKPKNQ